MKKPSDFFKKSHYFYKKIIFNLNFINLKILKLFLKIIIKRGLNPSNSYDSNTR